MSILEALLLGAIQGITEFLPISSSGHLVLIRALLNIDLAIPLVFDASVHVATLLVIVVYLRPEITYLGASLFSKKYRTHPKEWHLIQELVLASVVTALVGYVINVMVPMSVLVVSAGFAITSVLLAAQHYSDHSRRTPHEYGARRMVVAGCIGMAQGIAVVPGISRAGATICVALMLGMGRQQAVRFSLLLAIPAITSAFALSLLEYSHSTLHWHVIAAGAISSIVVGAFAVRVLAWLTQRSRLYIFIPYLLFLSIVSFIFSR